MRIIATINQKGGVGKTTTTLNLAHALALSGYTVLAIDADPQGNLTTSFGMDNDKASGVDAILLDDAKIDDLMLNVRPGVNLLPAGRRLAEMEFESRGGADRGFRLSRAIGEMAGRPDYILIDCPPSTGLIGMNSLLAANELLIPVSSDFLSMQGLARLLGIVDYIEDELNRQTRKWLVITRYQDRRRLARDIRAKLAECFPGQLLRTPVRENVSLAESPGCGKTIFDYRSDSHGAEDYRSLAIDLVEERTECETA